MLQIMASCEPILSRGVVAAELWARTRPETRAKVLVDAASLMEARSNQFADSIVRDCEATWEEADEEVRQAVEALKFCAAECNRLSGRIVPDPESETASRVFYQPAGLCAAFTDSARPLLSPARALAAALAAGSALIVSPPEDVRASAQSLVDALNEAGTNGAALLSAHRGEADVRSLACNPYLKYVRCEGDEKLARFVSAARTDGNIGILTRGAAPAVVMADADVELAARDIARAAFTRGGSGMEAIRRVFVARSIFDEFVYAFAQNAERWPDYRVRRYEAAQAHEAYVNAARGIGLRLLAGGPPERATVLWGEGEDVSRVAQPIRAPVALLAPFDTIAEATMLSNNPPPGLVAYAYTRDLTYSHRLCTDIDARHIAVNQPAPFIGALPPTPKGSEYAEPYGGIGEYMVRKHIRMRYP